MGGSKIQCVSKGQVEKNAIEYHVTWTALGTQYRSYVRSYSGTFQEISFGELQTISLDHYRLDEFEKMFILSFQRIDENDLKTDTNFNIAYEYLLNSNKEWQSASLIGVAQKPLSLGFIYHIFMRATCGTIFRVEVYLEIFSLKVTIKSIEKEEFTTGLIHLNQQDSSIKKIISVVEKQAKNPTLQGNSYTVQTVEGKDFLFGKMFVINIAKEGKSFRAFVYHDQGSEEVLLLNWGPSSAPSGCSEPKTGGKCAKCVEGYTMINDVCTFGCGILCKTVQF